MRKLRGELSNRDRSVTDAILDAGFNSSSRSYGQSSQALGMTPTAFRSGRRL